ncbi:hypothetical protein GJ496_009369 [Pomphorhynchus laevis]|nr:hypothetical protein GJ496_009369 [Pomphorhynchus laevis]
MQYHSERKRSKYVERISKVENCGFVLFIVSAAGGIGMEANALLKQLATLRLLRDDTGYAGHVTELRTQLVFKTLKTASICLHAQKHLLGHRERND